MTDSSPRPSSSAGVDAAALVRELGARLGDGHATPVIWMRDGSETLVHLDGLHASITSGVVTVAVDFENDQLPRQPLKVSLALPTPDEPPGFFAVTPSRADGDAALAARWGSTFAEAVWTAMLELADSAHDAPAAGIAAGDGLILIHPPGPTAETGRQPDPGT